MDHAATEQMREEKLSRVSEEQKAEVGTRWEDDPGETSSALSTPLSILNDPPLSGAAAGY